MATTIVDKPSLVYEACHWLGRLSGAAVILLFVVFAIGLGLPSIAQLNAGFAALAVMLVGYAAAWWDDLAGGVVALLGWGWFQALEVAANGHPAGGAFPWIVLPAVLLIVAAAIRPQPTEGRPPQE